MVSKSTKRKYRRQDKILLPRIRLIDPRCDLWLVSRSITSRVMNHQELTGKVRAWRAYRRLMSLRTLEI